MILPELIPYTTAVCNALLLQGYLPESRRHAGVVPRLKKANADQTDVKNYRPVSNLTFMSEVVIEMSFCIHLLNYVAIRQVATKL